MWFNPLEKLLGNIVDYEDEYSYLDKLEPDRLFTNMGQDYPGMFVYTPQLPNTNFEEQKLQDPPSFY